MRVLGAALLLAVLGACHPLPPPLPPAPAAPARTAAGPPAAALEHYALAILAWADGDLDTASTEIGQALLFDPGAGALHATRGRIALDRGEPAEAARAFTTAWTLAPGDLAVQTDRARAYTQAGEREKALAAYRLLLEHGRDDAAFADLIRLLQREGDPTAAREVMGRWREAPAVDPSWLRARAELCLELELDEEAWMDFATLVEGWAPEPPALQGLLAANDRTGHNRGTLELLERVARATPGDAHVLELLASLAGRVGDLERAIPAWEQVDRLQGGQDPFVRLSLARARIALGAPGAALALLDDLAGSVAGPLQVAPTRARALLALGRGAEALAVLDLASPETSTRALARARLYEDAGLLPEARDALRAVPLDEADWYQRWDLAVLEARTGGLDRALALIADPGAVDAPQARAPIGRGEGGAPAVPAGGRCGPPTASSPREKESGAGPARSLWVAGTAPRCDTHDQVLAAARLHALAGDLAGALRLAAEAEARHPDDPVIAAARAAWLADAGDDAGALAALRAAAGRDLVSPDLARQHAVLAWKAGCDGEARQALEGALAIFAGEASLRNDLAWFRVEHGEHGDDVLALIQRAVDQEPANAAFLDTLGWVLFQRGELAAALAELEHAARLEHENVTIAAHLQAARKAAPGGGTR